MAVEIIPMLGVVWISLTDYNPLEPDSWTEFVGGENYSRMLDDSLFWKSLGNTFFFAVLYLPISILGALLAATLLNQNLRGRLVYRGIFFMPVVVSWVVASTMIMWFLDPSSGFVSMVSQELGFGRLPQLLQDESTAMPAVAFVAIWKYFGYNTVIYLAGLQSVNPALEEAAKVDGASAFGRFWYVTLPALRPVTAVVVMLNMIQAIRIFDPMLIMTNGGPNYATTSTVLYVYRMAWDNLEFGYGSAITGALSLIIFAIAGLQFWFFNRRSVEG
ncbi:MULTISPECIES: sugar ABC transporter permease [unclassified Nocardioides]|uniref:carbohydrate ABC transporter permease n=1 Tax=unclassified Nocardioides TaxID=2615069 RepID=UPI001305456A|nr:MULTISPECIES: sugar ABC transporter permease [unclassified Nocardioides]